MTGDSQHTARTLGRVGEIVLRYGLVLVIFWIGCLKFTAYEAQGAHVHASNSPLLSWAYHLLDIRNFARVLGIVELAIALLIASRPLSPKASATGSFGAIAMFLTTLSVLLSTPGVWQAGYGFPFLSGAPGQFLLKDFVLLGAAIWTAGEALLAVPTKDRIAARAGERTKRAGAV